MHGTVCALSRVEGPGNSLSTASYSGNKPSLKLGVKKNTFTHMETSTSTHPVEGSLLIHVNVSTKMR